MPKFLSYVYPFHRSNDGRITRLLGQWIDGGSMERSVYISCSHNVIHIKRWRFLSSGRSKRAFWSKNIVQDLVAGFRSETFPHTKQLSTQQVDDDGGVKDFDENFIWFLFPGYTISFKSSFRICIKPPPPYPHSHNIWKAFKIQNRLINKLVKLGDCYQLVPECSESQPEYSS